MRDVLNDINNRYATLSKGQKKIAAYLKENYDKAAYMTAQKLGQAVGTSESTVVRFAAELGYDGYGDFQQNLQAIIRNKLTSLQRMDVAQGIIGGDDIAESIMNSDIENIRSTIENLDRKAFSDAVETLLKAKRIYVLGVRSSAALAKFISFYFNLMFDNVTHISTTSASEIFEQLLHTGEDDAVVAISYPRYSKRTVSAAEYAAGRGSKIIAITDSISSPITKFATHSLIAKSEMAYFVDSFAAPFSLANALLIALSMRKKKQLTESFETLEKIWDEYQVYEKTES